MWFSLYLYRMIQNAIFSLNVFEGWEYQSNKSKQKQDLHTLHKFCTYVKMIH